MEVVTAHQATTHRLRRVTEVHAGERIVHAEGGQP